MATRIKIREVKAGDYMRVHIFPVRNYHRGKRSKRYKESSEAQKRYNDKMAALRTADTLHANFTENDYALRLSYSDECPDLDGAGRDMDNFVRRLRYEYKKHGVELKAYAVTAEGKNGGRVHHHVVVNACAGVTDDQRLMRKIWNNGGRKGPRSYVNIEPLEFDDGEGMEFSDGGLTGLSKYIFFDNAVAASRPGKRRYFRTRNLVQPEIRETTGKISCREAAYINQTADKDIIGELYPEYTVRTVVPETFSDDEADYARFNCGLFSVAYLCRKEMRFNCNTQRRRESAKAQSSRR